MTRLASKASSEETLTALARFFWRPVLEAHQVMLRRHQALNNNICYSGAPEGLVHFCRPPRGQSENPK